MVELLHALAALIERPQAEAQIGAVGNPKSQFF
jgi:hypothetical protein